MKLYEVRTKNSDNDWHGQTNYVSSMNEVAALLRKAYSGAAFEVTTPERLSKEQWIGILEADAPGRQAYEYTPMDLLTRSEKPVKTKGQRKKKDEGTRE